MAQATSDFQTRKEEIQTRLNQRIDEARQEAQQELDALKEEAQAFVAGLTLDVSVNGSHVATPTKGKRGPKPGSKRGPKHGAEEATEAPAKGKPGPKPGSKRGPKHGTEKAASPKAPKAKKGKKEGEGAAHKGRGGGAGGAVFAKMIFDVLDRGKWPEVADLPKGVPGLTFSELFDNYLTGKMEKQQAHAALYDLKRRGLVERGDDKRNYVVAGAKME